MLQNSPAQQTRNRCRSFFRFFYPAKMIQKRQNSQKQKKHRAGKEVQAPSSYLQGEVTMNWGHFHGGISHGDVRKVMHIGEVSLQ